MEHKLNQRSSNQKLLIAYLPICFASMLVIFFMSMILFILSLINIYETQDTLGWTLGERFKSDLPRLRLYITISPIICIAAGIVTFQVSKRFPKEVWMNQFSAVIILLLPIFLMIATVMVEWLFFEDVIGSHDREDAVMVTLAILSLLLPVSSAFGFELSDKTYSRVWYSRIFHFLIGFLALVLSIIALFLAIFFASDWNMNFGSTQEHEQGPVSLYVSENDLSHRLPRQIG
ncbi:MAG: hypothetical protein WD077_03025 [Bacteroidia bacterium]